jgi:hypothetical protein
MNLIQSDSGVQASNLFGGRSFMASGPADAIPNSYSVPVAAAAAAAAAWPSPAVPLAPAAPSSLAINVGYTGVFGGNTSGSLGGGIGLGALPAGLVSEHS